MKSGKCRTHYETLKKDGAMKRLIRNCQIKS